MTLTLALTLALLSPADEPNRDDIRDDIGSPSKKQRYLASKAERRGHDRDPSGEPPRRADTPVFARNLHTHEVMVLSGAPPRLVDAFLRCHFTQHSVDIPDPLVAKMLVAAQHFGARQIHIVSGYRHPKYNKMLRKKGRQVAKTSQHTLGRAIDFALVGVPTAHLRRFMRARHAGGVGYYPTSGFIHIDEGPRRSWRGT